MNDFYEQPFSYSPLFETLETLELAPYDLRRLAHISDYDICKIKEGQPVSVYTLCEIARFLDIELSDIVAVNRIRDLDISEELRTYIAEKKKTAEHNKKLLAERKIPDHLIEVTDENGSLRYLCPACNSHRVTVGEYRQSSKTAHLYCEDCGWDIWENYIGKPFAPKF